MELITNGYFDSGDLEPWEMCSGELEGGIAGDVLGLCRYNLKLIGNDCVLQVIPGAVVASENLQFWLRWRPIGYFEHVSSEECGALRAVVNYSEGDPTLSIINLDWLRFPDPVTMLDPKRVTVPYDGDRYVVSIQLSAVSAGHPWYISGVTMDGYFVGGDDPDIRKSDLPMGARMAMLERKFARFERYITSVLSKVRDIDSDSSGSGKIQEK
jgi:hypothetical protein